MRDFEFQIRRPDGGTRWVVDTAYQVVDEESGRIFDHGILVDITARKELERRLHEAVIRDALTGSLNRHYLADLSARLEDAASLWGVVVCDLDRFKEVNDRLGHKAGDDLQVSFTRFLMRHSRITDLGVRLGGHEFLMLLPGANDDVTGAVAGRLRETAPEVAPVEFSLGWACRESTESVERTIARVDQRLITVRLRERGFPSPAVAEQRGRVSQRCSPSSSLHDCGRHQPPDRPGGLETAEARGVRGTPQGTGSAAGGS